MMQTGTTTINRSLELLTQAEARSIFNLALDYDPRMDSDEDLTIDSNEKVAIINHAGFQITIATPPMNEVSVYEDKGGDELEDVFINRSSHKDLMAYLSGQNPLHFSGNEQGYIESLTNAVSYDQPDREGDFLHTHLLGFLHSATVLKGKADKKYLYIIHPQSHSPKNEYIRTNDFEEFVLACARIDQLSMEEYEQTFYNK